MNTSPFSNKTITAGLATELFVQNLEKSLRFYTNFGFKIIGKSARSAHLRWEKSLLLLSEQDDLPARAALYASICVVVPNVDDYYQYGRRERLPVIDRIGTRCCGLSNFTAADPDGFGLRFTTPVARPTMQQFWLEKVQNNL